jgi:6-phosphogluconolactonase
MDVVYFSNEQGCSVTAYNSDPSAGTLAAFQTVSTLPYGYVGENFCSQIQVSSSGRFLYALNRGHNSIACFSIDAANGLLTPTQRMPTQPVPRSFGLDPEGTFLYAAGEESGRLASYFVDAASGMLEPLDIYDVGEAPVWVLIARLRA